MKKLRISSDLNLHYCTKDNVCDYVYQGILFLKKMGFDAANFPLNSLLKLMGEEWEYMITSAVEAATKVGIHFELCHLPYTWKKFESEEQKMIFNDSVHRAIDAAKLLGVDYAVLHPNSVTVPRECFDRQVEFDSVMRHLSPFVDHAVRVGVDLVVENMLIHHSHNPVYRYCSEPEELCDLADALGIGICWDFGHANINSLKQSDALACVGSRLKVLHVNDNYGKEDIHIAPFLGNINWSDAMKGLYDIGFDGLLNYELTMNNIPYALRETFAQYLVDAAKELMALIG